MNLVTSPAWQSLRKAGKPYVYRVQLQPYPLSSSLRNTWSALVQELIKTYPAAGSTEWEVFLQINGMHLDNTKDVLPERGKDWMPEVAMGLFPDGPPPALYTEDDILSLSPGELPRPMSHQLLRISKEGPPRAEAAGLFAGSGALALCLPRYKGAVEALSEPLRKTITDLTFRSFPKNLPLLTFSTADNAGKVPMLDQVLESVSVSLWEDYGNGAACLVADQPLDQWLATLK